MNLPEFEKASYNGVVFSLPVSERSAQRAIVQHHSPYAKHSPKDDLGLLSESISVNAFVWGKGAYAQAAKLRQELDKGGAGTLMHPEYGKVPVFVQSYKENSDYADGLLFVAFHIVFLRVNEDTALGDSEGEYKLRQSHEAEIKSGALALQEEFRKGAELRIRRIPAKKRLNLDELRREIAAIQNELQNLLHLMNAPTEYAQELLALMNEGMALTMSPFEIAGAIMNTWANFGEVILSVPAEMLGNLNKALSSVKGAFERFKRLTDGTTPQQYEMQLQAAAMQLTSILVGAPKVSFQSKEQAEKATKEIKALVGALKPKLEYATFERLVETEREFLAEMGNVAKTLPKEKALKNTEPLNVALFRVKGKAARQVPNPFFPQDGPEEVAYV